MLVKRWYGFLGLPPQPASWYPQALRDEQEELLEATTAIDKLSETSDVYFVHTRAFYDRPLNHDHNDHHYQIPAPPPFATPHDLLVYGYMIAKLTSRWLFYRTAAVLARAPRPERVREVVNPKKVSKLDAVASRHGIDLPTFRKVCRRLSRVWWFLP